MKGSLAVCERDVRKFLRQPFLILSTIVGPLLTLVLLGSAFGGAITHAPIAIVQESYGPFSSNFIDILRNQQSCEVGVINCQNSFQITYVPDMDTAQQMLREGLVKAIVHIPEGFDTSLSENSKVIVTVTLDNTDPLSAASHWTRNCPSKSTALISNTNINRRRLKHRCGFRECLQNLLVH